MERWAAKVCDRREKPLSAGMCASPMRSRRRPSRTTTTTLRIAPLGSTCSGLGSADTPDDLYHAIGRHPMVTQDFTIPDQHPEDDTVPACSRAPLKLARPP